MGSLQSLIFRNSALSQPSILLANNITSAPMLRKEDIISCIWIEPPFDPNIGIPESAQIYAIFVTNLHLLL